MLLSCCVTIKEEFTLVSCTDNKGEICEIGSNYLKCGVADVYPVFFLILRIRSLYSVASE